MRTVSKSILGLSLLLALGSALPLAASEEPASREDRIRELLELTGSGELGLQVMQGMIGPMRQALPQIPPEWWDRFMSEVDPDDLTALVIPIYEKHFTDEEIDAMLEFYRSSVGRSIVSKLPTVTQESMAVGQVWGRELMERIVREAQADGYEVPGLSS